PPRVEDPERRAVDDGPGPGAVASERGDRVAGQRLDRPGHVSGERPEPHVGADEDARGHARMILSVASDDARRLAMKTDLLLIPMSARWADMRAAALAAEGAGFDGLWTWDHLRDPDDDAGPGVPEAWTVLTALAEVTRRVMLRPF